MPKIVTLDLIEPGAVLSEPVTNSMGQTLIGSGITLTSKHISILRTWNIHSIKISDGENDNEPELNSELLAHAKIELSRFINWEPRNDAEADLIELGIIATVYRIKDTKHD